MHSSDCKYNCHLYKTFTLQGSPVSELVSVYMWYSALFDGDLICSKKTTWNMCLEY